MSPPHWPPSSVSSAAGRHADGGFPVIVYGDPQYEEPLASLLDHLRDLLAALPDEAGSADQAAIGSTEKVSRSCRSAALARLRSASGSAEAAQARHSGK